MTDDPNFQAAGARPGDLAAPLTEIEREKRAMDWLRRDFAEAQATITALTQNELEQKQRYLRLLEQAQRDESRAHDAEAKVTALTQEKAALNRKVSWLEGVRLPHARKQENANGFQRGWHAALARVQEGDAVDSLSMLVPEPSAEVEIPVCEAEAEVAAQRVRLAQVEAERDELKRVQSGRRSDERT